MFQTRSLPALIALAVWLTYSVANAENSTFPCMFESPKGCIGRRRDGSDDLVLKICDRNDPYVLWRQDGDQYRSYTDDMNCMQAGQQPQIADGLTGLKTGALLYNKPCAVAKAAKEVFQTFNVTNLEPQGLLTLLNRTDLCVVHFGTNPSVNETRIMMIECSRLSGERAMGWMWTLAIINNTVAPTTLSPTPPPSPGSTPPTTQRPTTLSPSTVGPTTAMPTTARPTTARPTTISPTTLSPTLAPVVGPTQAPTTMSPTTASPSTTSPTTISPTSLRPTTSSPTTLSPTSALPTTLSPTATKPTTSSPTTQKPTTAPTQTTTSLSPTTLPPTGSPTKIPTQAPTLAPTTPPTPSPTLATPLPTKPPTPSPTLATPLPTKPPTPSPTLATPAPTLATPAPTLATPAPTLATPAPTLATPAPTQAPTPAPTQAPTPSPTQAPTPSPTQAPVPPPTQAPTLPPTLPPTPASSTSDNANVAFSDNRAAFANPYVVLDSVSGSGYGGCVGRNADGSYELLYKPCRSDDDNIKWVLDGQRRMRSKVDTTDCLQAADRPDLLDGPQALTNGTRVYVKECAKPGTPAYDFQVINSLWSGKGPLTLEARPDLCIVYYGTTPVLYETRIILLECDGLRGPRSKGWEATDPCAYSPTCTP